MLVPKLVTTLKDYTRQQFANDLLAGVIVGVVALPLAIAFAIASGVTPQAGLYTAIIAGFIISSLGGSRVQIGGPTGAFVVIVYGIVQRYGIEGLTIATVMAGLILIALGLAGLGGAIKFIPFPVTTGFTAGIAVVIFSGQIKDLLGLEMGPVPAEFVEKWRSLGQHLGSFNPAALGTALAALGGSLGADLLPIYPGYPNDYLVYFLIVVAVAGIGNIRGALAVALAFGVADTMIRYFLPGFGRVLIFLLVMAVLFRNPHGFAPKIHA